MKSTDPRSDDVEQAVRAAKRLGQLRDELATVKELTEAYQQLERARAGAQPAGERRGRFRILRGEGGAA